MRISDWSSDVCSSDLDFVAVDNVSLDIFKREFFSLLGPSGCGKTTLLRMLAGFETPSEGAILLEGEDMSGVPPYQRPVNMMFQSYALFPHMNVEKNRSEEHTSELQSLMRISYAVFCLKKKKK